MRTIRVWFTKLDEAAYISHLDLQRAIQRALAASGLPVWYSQGFNPHIYLTFALPLPLGQQSTAESFDFRSEAESLGEDEVFWRLRGVLPKGIEIFDVTEPRMGPGEIAFADYLIRFDKNRTDVQKTAEEFFSQASIPVVKKTKRAEMTIDLSPYLARRRWLPFSEGACLDLILPAGSSFNLNPDLILHALEEGTGILPEEVDVTRTRVLTEDLSEFA